MLGGAARASPASATERHDHDEISGSWRVDVHNDNGDQTDSIISFAGGGVCVVHDISPAGPPFTGSWRSGRNGSFRATVSPAPGRPRLTRGDHRAQAAGSGAARHDRRVVQFRVTDPDGNQLDTVPARSTGHRSRPDRPPLRQRCVASQASSRA